MKHKFLLAFPLLWLSCNEAPTARPDAFMRIGLPSTDNYAPLKESAPFGLDINAEAKVIVKDVLAEEGNEEVREGEYWLDVVYPSILSTVQFTYKPVDNNLEALVRDAQQLAYKHTVKASGMREQFFEYKDKKVYGLYYELSGASATTTQFYATDSTQHFLRGVLYHYSAPNADSLAPVTEFMQAEILEMISSLHWNNAP
jgi:gliding motility-associated lipoprotein GldD